MESKKSVLRQPEAFEIGLVPVERSEDAPKRLSGEGVSPVMIVNHDAPSVRVAVDSCSGRPGPVQGKAIALHGSNQLSDRSVAK